MSYGTYQALAGRLQLGISDIERVVQRVEILHDKAQKSGDSGYLDGIALNLHSFYTGIESLFEDIARTLDQAIPSGGNWHKELMQQMGAQLDGVRPSVLSEQTRFCLDEYRAFRHLVRNIYTFNLRPSRMKDLAEGLKDCFQMVTQDLADFIKFLKEIAHDT